ncbi:DNA alkylation repair protein [Candidatus Woesearchaeota archaeon]|nr:DNA alkylation repair protein [Candidatus Woesearchaeota archaeon]
MLKVIKQDLQKLANQEKAKILQRFFKTGKGEYGEGDIFLGITVPELRKVANKYLTINIDDIKELLESEVHEHRLAALLLLVEKYKKCDGNGKKQIVKFYLRNTKRINNWDLVDLTADKILGHYLLHKNKAILYKLIKSSNLWERRTAIISTFAFIRNNEFNDSLKISKILLKDKHDLIQKAVGWMLREVGKRNQGVEEQFLKKHCKIMPRTTLRYAVERFDKGKREFYLRK